jgi:hypothetical protein
MLQMMPHSDAAIDVDDDDDDDDTRGILISQTHVVY